MKTIGHHFVALQWALQQFSKGKFLLYFIPGMLIALFFWWLNSILSGWGTGEGFWATVGSYASAGLSWTNNFIMVFLILTVLSPINTFLSEGVDKQLTGMTVDFDLVRIFNDLVRMIFVVSLAFLFEMIFMGVWYLFAWMFGLEVLSPAVFLLSSSFFYGFSFYDYSLERYEIGLGGSFRFSKKYFFPTLVTGLMFLGMYNIPVVGIAIAPVFATIISTHVFLKSTGRLDQIKKQKETQNA